MRTVTRRQRAVMLAAVFVTIVGVTATASGGAGAIGNTTTHVHTASTFFPHTAKQAAFQDEMRKLWEDHVTWTRLTIVSATGSLPDTAPTVARLLRNQDDIGKAIVPYFGQAAGDQLASLLRDHINGAITLVGAAIGGDPDEIREAKKAWYANGQQIAEFLANANPRFWPLGTMSGAMVKHLDQTFLEAALRLAGDHDKEIDAYDDAHDHILVMADLLSSGIIRQFPEKFA